MLNGSTAPPPPRRRPRRSRPVSLHLTATIAAILGLLCVAPGTPLAKSSDDPELLGEEKDSEDECPRHAPPEAASDAKRLTLLGVSCFKAEEFAQAYTYYHRAFEQEESDLPRAAMGRSPMRPLPPILR